MQKAFLVTALLTAATHTQATSCIQPENIKPIENYAIISTNIGTINIQDSFSGSDLIYQIKAHPHNKKNRVNINAHSGIIKIKADKKDNFDISVIAKNNCGSATAKFNVEIDEET